MKTLTKKTAKGQTAVISVTAGGTASSTIDGVSTGCTCGMITYLDKPIGNIVAHIVKVGLTKEEAAEVAEMLKGESSTSTLKPAQIRKLHSQAMMEMNGDINQFNCR